MVYITQIYRTLKFQYHNKLNNPSHVTGYHNSHGTLSGGAIRRNLYFHFTIATSSVPWKQSVMQSNEKDGYDRDSLTFPRTMDYMEFFIQDN